MLVVGRQHALIKKCALNNEVRLITQVYGITVLNLIQRMEKNNFNFEKRGSLIASYNIHVML